jgi:hypothetical protein
MPGPTPLANTKSRSLEPYLKSGKIGLDYQVGPGAEIVTEEDFWYTLYRVQVRASDGSQYRHLLVVPTNISAASFNVGIALLESDSDDADAGRFETVERLPQACKSDHGRFRVFPPPSELNRFCM